MIAVLYKGQSDRVASEVFNQLQRMGPRNVRVFHALQDMHGTMRTDDSAKQKIVSPVLEQLSRHRIGLGRILSRAQPEPFSLDVHARIIRELLPHELFGEIDGRCDEDHARKPVHLAETGELARHE
jgi:hypothetical protein